MNNNKLIHEQIEKIMLKVLYNKSIAELESMINEADRHKIKRLMNEDKTEKWIKINAVKQKERNF